VPRARVGNLEIEYETHGDPAHPPILLVMGLGAQLTRWPEPFYRALVDGGHHVIRYDNRDIGLSTKLDASGRPDVLQAVVRAMLRLPPRAPYLLDDMANDAVGLLDALGMQSAHVVGASMGGMIGQILAARHAPRVRSFVSIMSTSGSRSLPGPRLALQLGMLRTQIEQGFRKRGRDAAIEQIVRSLKSIESPAFPADESALRARVTRDFDRCHCPQGFGRQLMAIVASGSRRHLLGDIRAPTLIIHGKEDPLVPVAAAYHLQKHIAGARLEVIAGMGHDVPPPLVPRLSRLILDLTRSAELAAAGATPRPAFQ
jgi:pimeloyl-ACP methyl ester carboxylesterase